MVPAYPPPARPLILVAESDAFRVDYLSQALHDAGMQVLGPVRAIAEAATLLDRLRARPGAAIVGLRLRDGASAALLDLLDEAGIPLLLLGEAGRAPPPRLVARPCLLAPFASYQVVDAVRALLRTGAPPRDIGRELAPHG